MQVLVLEQELVIGLETFLEKRHEVQVLKINANVLVTLYH